MKILPRNRWIGKRYKIPMARHVGIMTIKKRSRNGKYLCCSPEYRIKERILTETKISELIDEGYWEEIK